MEHIKTIIDQYINKNIESIYEDGISFRLYSGMVRTLYDQTAAILSDAEYRIIERDDIKNSIAYKAAIAQCKRLLRAHGQRFISLLQGISKASPFEHLFSEIYRDIVIAAAQ